MKSNLWNRVKDALFGASAIRDAEADRICEPEIRVVEKGISMTGRELYEKVSEENRKEYEDDFKSFRERIWRKSIKISGNI